VLEEDRHVELAAEMSKWETFVSSALLLVEAMRACSRYGALYGELAARELEAVSLVPVDRQVLQRTAGLTPASLRSLDAIHLATALTLTEELGAFIAYDERLCAAARTLALPVSTP
jgi:predicted nucleic acid-binding protein